MAAQSIAPDLTNLPTLQTMHAMGSIRELSSGQTQLLQPEHLVGRASTCALRLSHRWVSAQHALLRWAGGRWEVKDLGSRNGTFLDGSRLKPGDDYVVRRGAKLAFGKVSEGQWEVADTSPPPAMAVPLDGGEPVQIDGDFIALPSSDDPRVTIYRNQEGVWVLEHPDESSAPILHLQTFEVSGRGWRFCCAEEIRTTALGPSPADLEVCHLSLAFSVSRDEEHVELQASSRGVTFDLGARAHNYLLLTLARRRLKDAEEGLPHIDVRLGRPGRAGARPVDGASAAQHRCLPNSEAIRGPRRHGRGEHRRAATPHTPAAHRDRPPNGHADSIFRAPSERGPSAVRARSGFAAHRLSSVHNLC